MPSVAAATSSRKLADKSIDLVSCFKYQIQNVCTCTRYSHYVALLCTEILDSYSRFAIMHSCSTQNHAYTGRGFVEILYHKRFFIRHTANHEHYDVLWSKTRPDIRHIHSCISSPHFLFIKTQRNGFGYLYNIMCYPMISIQ